MRTAVFFAITILLAGAGVCAQPGLALEVGTDRTIYRERIDNQIYVEARVRPPGPKEAAIPAVRNLALVLDRSGSMAGERIEALRAALGPALRGLAGGDFVSVVLFGSEVETLIEAQRCDELRDLDARIAQIEPAGGAALFDALNQAAAQLRRHATPTTINQILLITDGPPTKGPRDRDDFARLAEVFAGEAISIATIGLGEDCEEDTLAALARATGAKFRYVDQPANLAAALQAELTRLSGLVGIDATLTIQFDRAAEKIESACWPLGAVSGQSLTYRFPRLLAGQTVTVMGTARVDAFSTRFDLLDFATIQLRWTDPASGEARQLSRPAAVRFGGDAGVLRDSLDPVVSRTMGRLIVREALQNAIEHIDQGDFRRALRDLRTARTDVRDLNYDVDDPELTEVLARLDAYLAVVQPRGLNALDRKVLRAGLLNQFDPPVAAPKK